MAKLVCIAMKVEFNSEVADVMHRHDVGTDFAKYDPHTGMMDAVFLMLPEREEAAMTALSPYVIREYYRTEQLVTADELD